jgi:hypothetical protein
MSRETMAQRAEINVPTEHALYLCLFVTCGGGV